MAEGDFNYGRHCRVVIQHPLAPNGRLDLSIVTDFDAKASYQDLQSRGLDGVSRSAFLPDSWEISLGLDRATSAADDFAAALESAYYDSGSLPNGTVYQYVDELNGSESTYQYENVALRLEDAGTWKGDSTVQQRLMGRCSRRRRVA